MDRFILVHGWELFEDGTPEDILLDKLDHTISRLSEGLQARSVIVAGRHGKRDKAYVENSGITEAEVMRDYLVSKGIPEKKIILEPNGTNTWDCTVYAHDRIIVPGNYDSGVIISNLEHLPRVVMQTMQVFSPELLRNVSFEGRPTKNPSRRREMIGYELKTIGYTLEELARHASELRDRS